MANQEFETPRDALAHYGVKGMKWGVRNDRKSSGGGRKSGAQKPPEESDALQKASDEFYDKQSPAKLQAEGSKKLKDQVENGEFPTAASAREVKRAAKADAIEDRAAKYDKAAQTMAEYRDAIEPGRNPWKRYERSVYDNQVQINEKARDDLLKKAEQVRSGKLTDSQKKLLIAGGIAAVAVAGAYGSNKYLERKTGLTRAKKKQLEADNLAASKDEWSKLFGDTPDFVPAGSAFTGSGSGFYAGLKSKKVWDRPEFEIPEGTVFQRLSNHIEDSADYGKVKGAYATFLSNDKKLYGSGSEFGHKKYTVTFTSKGPTRVPNHRTVLAQLKQVMDQESGHSVSESKVAMTYHEMAGAGWSDSRSKSLFSSLRQLGYSAIVDDMDAGYLGDLPVVYFGDANPATATPRTISDRMMDGTGLLKVTGKYA